MNFEKLFRHSIYINLIAGAVILSAARQHWLYAALMAAACLLHAVAVARQPGFHLSRRAAVLVSIFAIAYTFYDARNSELVLFTSANFMVMLQIIKLFQPKTSRDYKELFLMSLVLTSVAAVMTADIVFAPTFIFYVASAVWSLMLFAIRTDAAEGGTRPTIGARTVGAGAVLSLVCLAGALAVFLLFPRMGSSFPHLSDSQRSFSGFTNTVQLQRSGRITPNQQIVFKASLGGPRAELLSDEDLLWRGVAFDHFDGRTWRTTVRTPASRVLPFNDDAGTGSRIKQKIELAPSRSRALFALGRIRGMVSGDTIEVASVLHDEAHDSYSTRVGRPATFAYEVVSELPPPREMLAEYDRPTTRRMGANLQLPAVSSRMSRLAGEITDDAKYPTKLEKIEAVVNYLQSTCRYTTELPGNVSDPVDNFLFVTKQGHCELFASAMVVLLRSVRIPARLAGGYAGGQWNEFLDVYVVRQSYAHAWVEVYFDSLQQWVPFDPTPGEAIVHGRESGMLAYLSRMVDYVNTKWTENIIYYGQEHQANLARRVGNFVASGAEWLGMRNAQHSASVLGAVLGWILRAAIAAAAAGLCWLAFRRLLRVRFRRTYADRSRTKFYRDMLKLLEKRGHRRLPSQTPLEFARQVVACEGPKWADVDAITGMFCAVRYGNGGHVTEAAERETEEKLRKLKLNAKGKPKANN